MLLRRALTTGGRRACRSLPRRRAPLRVPAPARLLSAARGPPTGLDDVDEAREEAERQLAEARMAPPPLADADGVVYEEADEPEEPYSPDEFRALLSEARERLESSEGREVERVRLVQLAKDQYRELEERLDPRMTSVQRAQMLELAADGTEPENPMDDEEFVVLYEETRSQLLDPSTREAVRERLRKMREDWKLQPAERMEPRLLWRQRAALLRLAVGVYAPYQELRMMYERYRLVDYIARDPTRTDSGAAELLHSVVEGDALDELVARTSPLDDTLRSVMEAVGVDPTPSIVAPGELSPKDPDPVSENEAQRFEEFGTEDMVFPDEFSRLRDAEDVEKFDPRPDKKMYERCPFCRPDATADQRWTLDHLNLELLLRHVNLRGQIVPRRRTGVCAKHQRALTRQVKYARYLGLLDYTTKFEFGENEQDLAALCEADRLLLAQSDEDWLAGASSEAVLSADGVMEGDDRTDEQREAEAAEEAREQEAREERVRRMEEEREAIFAEFRTRPLPPMPGQTLADRDADGEEVVVDLTTAEADVVQGRVHPTTRWLEGQKRAFRRRWGQTAW